MPSRSPTAPNRARTLAARLGTHFPQNHKLPKVLPPEALALIAPLDNDFPGISAVVIGAETVQLWGKRGSGPWKPMSPPGQWDKPVEIEPLVVAAREAAGVRWYVRPLAIAREMVAESGFREQHWTFRTVKSAESGWRVDCFFEGEVLQKEWGHHRPGIVSQRSTEAKLLVQRGGLKFEGVDASPAPLLLDDMRARVDAERARVQELLEIGYRERMWQLWSQLTRDFVIGLDPDLTIGLEFAVRLPDDAGDEDTRVVVTAGHVLHQVREKSEKGGKWACVATERSWLPGIREIVREFLLQDYAQAQRRIVRPEDGAKQYVLRL